MRPYVMLAAAALLAAVPVPASASVPYGSCEIVGYSTSAPSLTTPHAHYGRVVGTAVHDDGPVTITCQIRVNGAVADATPPGTGDPVAVTVGAVSYLADDLDQITICAEMTSHIDATDCVPVAPGPHIPNQV